MSKIKLTTVDFTGTAEQEKTLRAELQVIKNMQGNTMPALQAAQAIYGYLPIEVQKIIADELSISLEEVFGIATFYSQFVLNPKGETSVAVCLGTACYVKGSGEVFDKISKELGLADGETTPDGKFSLSSTRCIGCCGLAPVMTVNADVYGKLTVADVPGIIAKYRA
ncbi:MAG: NAD(P)H-dependent oxidoreductase subunit E [Clostridia bacterium]